MFKTILSKDIFVNLYLRIFCRSKYQKFNKLLLNCGLKGLGINNYQNLFVSGELNFLKKYLLKIETPIIFDIGANKGDYALTCKRINSKSKIFCFEPHPTTFTVLKTRIKDDNVVLINQALSSSQGKFVLYDYAHKNGSSHATLCNNII